MHTIDRGEYYLGVEPPSHYNRVAFRCNYPRAVWSAGIWSRNAILSSLHSREEGREGERKKKKIAPKIERSRNKLNFAFGRS